MVVDKVRITGSLWLDGIYMIPQKDYHFRDEKDNKITPFLIKKLAGTQPDHWL